jgi:hypothetical protein
VQGKKKRDIAARDLERAERLAANPKASKVEKVANLIEADDDDLLFK